jgi:cyanophycin synthetase
MTASGYNIVSTRVYEAATSNAPVPAVRFQVNIKNRNDFEPAFNNINSCLRQISVAGSGGLLSIEQPDDESLIGHFLNLTVALLEYTNNVVSFSKIQSGNNTDEHLVFIGHEDHQTVLYAGEVATEFLNAIIVTKGIFNDDVSAVLRLILDELFSFSFPRRLDPNSRLLIQAALQLGIPAANLEQPPFEPSASDHIIQNGHIQFGWGIKLKRCLGSMPSGFIPHQRLRVVFDRARLFSMLQDAAIPIPKQDPGFINRNGVHEAQKSAQHIGYPVTTRPGYGRTHDYCFSENNVFGPLFNDTNVALAANFILETENIDVWVESSVAGDHYQFLVLGNEVVSVIRNSPPSVTGDGEHSISWLATRQAEQSDNLLDYRAWKTLATGDAGENCRLQLSGLNIGSIPDPGMVVALRAEGTLYNGGSCQDVTDWIPEGFKTVALKTAELTGLSRIAGVSMVINNPAGQVMMPNCAVTAVVPNPDLQAHAQPGTGDPHQVPARFLGQLFPTGDKGRIPVVSITGTNGKTTTSRMVTAILQQAGYKVGLTCSDGVYLDGELLTGGDCSSPTGALYLLTDPATEVAVLETARGAMATMGIAFDQCQVGACLNIAADHIGLNNINSLDEMAVHKRQVIERTTGTAVLNAEDSRCLAMRDHTQADHVVLVASNADLPVITKHCKAGGTALVLDRQDAGGSLCLCDGSGITPLVALNEIPATWNGMAFHNVENALFAAAISVGLGIGREVIAASLRDFRMSLEQTPGRLNIFDGLPYRVILDSAHNAHGMKAFCDFSNQLEVEGRRILVFTMAGNRIAAEVEASAASVAGSFDYFICRDPYELRGRSAGDIPKLLKAGLMDKGVPENRIEVYTDNEKGLERALELANNGDLLVVFAGRYFGKAWDAIKQYQQSTQSGLTAH